MKKFIALAILSVIAACSDQCSSVKDVGSDTVCDVSDETVTDVVVDGTETSTSVVE